MQCCCGYPCGLHTFSVHPYIIFGVFSSYGMHAPAEGWYVPGFLICFWCTDINIGINISTESVYRYW